MKTKQRSVCARIICLLLILCTMTTMLSSCGLWDFFADIFRSDDPNPPTTTTPPTTTAPSVDDPEDDTPSGDTETTYYKVSFAVAIEEYKSRVTLPKEKLYEEGTEIQYLPTPGVRDLLFMGWYYDAAMTRPVALTDKVTSDLMLYAKVVDTTEDISVIEGVYYHTAYDVDADYTFAVKAASAADVESGLSIVNISSAGAPLVPGEDYTITANGDGTFKVSVKYKAGKTYRASFAEGNSLSFVVDGTPLSEQVTTLNVLVAKAEVSNLTLSDGLIYIPRTDVVLLTDAPNGLVSVSDGGATVNSGDTGYFSYEGARLKSGDKIAIYEGAIPTERDFVTNNGAVKYLTVTGVEKNNVYKFRVSDTKEVLFIPDIIPVAGKTNVECETKIPVAGLDFTSDLYKQLGMSEDTVVEVGDYIAFFDGPMSEGTAVEYVRIKSVSRDNKYYYIDYVPVSYDDVIASMDIYHTRTETPVLSEQQITEIKANVYRDAMESGFVDEAAAYLVELYLSTGGLEFLPDGTVSGANASLMAAKKPTSSIMSLSSYTVSQGAANVALAAAREGGVYYEVTKCEAAPDIKIGEGVLKHFEGSNGIRVELILSFEVEFTVGEDGENKVVIAAEAVFEEEVLLTLNVDGGAVWETAWIFPYIADYEMNANIDIGTYTGVSVIAKVYTNNGEEKEEEEDDDSFFPDFDLDNIGKGDTYEEKAKNIGEELKKLFELNDNIKEEIEGEEEDDTGNDITEKYAEMMKDANEAWIEIVKVEIFKQSMNIDQFGILWFEISLDFVVSAQLYVVAGIEVETGVAKRYNFSVTLFDRTVKTDVIDLEKAHFTFKFYCMGTAGLKVGLEAELSLALLSSDVASVGVSAELGVSLGLWGYFYYSYEKEAGEEAETQKAGAMFFELGIYLEVKFKAHLFNIEKLTYNPTLYENLWPLYSVGTQENVFEFEDYEDSKLVFVMQGTNTLVLPDYIFRMKYLDLKDGKYYAGTDAGDETPSKSFDDETESRFLIEISDSRFTYNPKTNTLSTTVDVKNMDVSDSFSITIRLTYKQGALAFNQEIITREITVEVKNNAEYGYIYVSLNGPATLNAEGPGGSLSYPVKHGEAFTVDMLPKYDVVDGYKFVKWIWMQNYRDVNGKLWQEGDDFVGLDSAQRRTYLYLTAVWEPQAVEHTVRIFKETLGGAYVYDRTETITAPVGSQYSLRGFIDTGYTYRYRERGTIYVEYGGSYDLYIQRAAKTICFKNIDGEGGEISISAKSGAALVPPVVSSWLGYDFAGWAEGSAGNTACEMPDSVPYVNGNVIYYTALWTPVTDVSYTVKHYVQNPNDDGYELYMTEYLTGAYDETIRASAHVNRDLTSDGFGCYYEDTVYKVALDGSTVLRIYYTRNSYEMYHQSYGSSGYARTGLGYYRHGATVDLSAIEFVPRKDGYRFVGWDADGDGATDDTFIMPKSNFKLIPVWEGAEGTEYKVIHMVKDADTDNYVQAGVTYMYGVTDTTPTAASIYSDKYIVAGQFVPNYEKARVTVITANGDATMYAYYDRVEYTVVIRAYHPETGNVVKEVTRTFPYGRSIILKYLPMIESFDVIKGYTPSRYASSGYSEMPDHDIEMNVVYNAASSTPFVVNHYVENTDGTFSLLYSYLKFAPTGTALHDSYRQYRLTDYADGERHMSLSADMVEETYVAGDGSTAFNLYYVRDKVKMSGTLYKLDVNGNIVDTTAITEWYRYNTRLSLHGYYDNYELDRFVDKTGGKTYYSWNNVFYTTEDSTVEIYVKPKSGVPYTVTHWVESVDGTGYEIYATYSYTGSHSATVSAENNTKTWFGFEADSAQYESIVLDAAKENNLNVYYSRKAYTVEFYNAYKPGASVSHQVKFGAVVPTPPTDTDVPGYDFVEWESYAADSVVSGDVRFCAVYMLSTNTPYTVNHYVMGVDGGYQLALTEARRGSTNAVVKAEDHLHANYSNGYTLGESTSVRIAPDGSTVLDVYYDRVSYRFSYHYYVGGKVVNSIGVLVMNSAPTPDSIFDYSKDYPEYELDGYSVLVNGEYVKLDEVPATMGAEDIEIRVTLKAIGPEVTIVHKVMNTDGVTYTDIPETFLAIPFEALDLADHLLASVKEGFTYRIPVNNQIPDALAENVYEIYYDRNTYTVQYVSNYNFETITESYLYGASIGATPVFARPGYTQVGWNAVIPETMPARNLAYTTVWQLRESVPVTIIHMMTALDGDGYVEKHRETVMYTPELMIYGSNYAINLAGGTYKNAEKTIVTEDGSTEVCVYYTRDEYTVRFTYGTIAGGGEDVVLVLPYESAIAAPDFKVTGYRLVGWSPALPTTVQAENATYTAVWAAEGVSVTVNHWIDGLDGVDTIVKTETVSADADSTINGAVYQKTPDGFTYRDADKNVVVERDGSTVINVYYTRNSYKVTYTYGDMPGHAVEHTVKYGAALPAAPVFSVIGYTFAGWDSALAATMPASDLTYAAQWTANTDTRFTVEHYWQNADDDGYTKVKTETKYGVTGAEILGEDHKAVLANAIYESAENAVIAANGATVVKVYYKRTTYTLTFGYGEQSGDPIGYKLRYGQKVSYNPSFVVQGYVFNGWDKIIPDTMPAEDVTLNATWVAGAGIKYTVNHYVQNADDNGYTLTSEERSGMTGETVDGATIATMLTSGFVLKSADNAIIAANGSTVINIYYDRVSYTVTYLYGAMTGDAVTHTVRYGAKLPSAPVFMSVGYGFAGWDSDLALTMPASDLAYTAQWTANTDTKFTVEHYWQNADDDGYTVVKSETMQGTTASVVKGVDFKRNLEEAVFEKADEATIAPDGSTVIKVYYKRTTYTLTFSYGFVSDDSQSYTVRYGATLPSAPVFGVIGYTFDGWIDEEGLSVDQLAKTMPGGALVYTARWIANEDTAFKVEHYVEEANGNGYELFGAEKYTGRTDSTVDDLYSYVLYDNGQTYVFERFSTEDLVILPDGSAVLKIYYQRVRYTVTFYVVNQVENPIDGLDPITDEFKYGQKITPPEITLLEGYEFMGFDTRYETMPDEAIEYCIFWNCLHSSTDSDDVCDRCWEPLDCTDNNGDGHCDYCRTPLGEEHQYADPDNDHICNICGGHFTDLCIDADENGVCDVCDCSTLCPVTGDDHADEDDNHKCDDCEVWMSDRCAIAPGSHQCGICLEVHYNLCTDEDKNCQCDECYTQIPCVDRDGDRICDVCGGEMPCTGHVDANENAICDYCHEQTWCDEFDDMHRDENYDHICDNCGIRTAYDCIDSNEDGRCDECAEPAFCDNMYEVEHIDEDGDHVCDACYVWISYLCTDGGDSFCGVCGNELLCWIHIDADKNALCDRCGEETRCYKNPYDAAHWDDDGDHTCDFEECGVWLSLSCYDDDYDGYCDEEACKREIVCDHVDDDDDNYCDLCYRIIDCDHEYVSEHICDTCNQRVSDCNDPDHDGFCDECFGDVPCDHEGMDGEHVCFYCWDYLTDCFDEDGDGECDLSEYFPHQVTDRS